MTIAIDPGKNTGVALYPGGAASPIVCSWVEPGSVEILAFLRWAKSVGFTTVVIEDQHLPRPKVKNGKVAWRLDWPKLQKLIRGADRWMVCAEVVGLRVEWIKSASWQGKMLGSFKDQTTKQRASDVVQETWATVRRFKPGEDPSTAKVVKTSAINEHIRDAVLMGRWWLLFGGGL